MSDDSFVAVCPICLSLDYAACGHTVPFLDVLAHDGEYFVHLTDYAALRAALAERDGRIAALEVELEVAAEDMELTSMAILGDAERLLYADKQMGQSMARSAQRARAALTPPPPYPCTSDQYTHTHHYPHGDEGDA
jgi:hypothetical protein